MAKTHCYLILFIGLTFNTHADEQIPDAELLEFIADWETEDDQWLDPELFLETPEFTMSEEVQDEN